MGLIPTFLWPPSPRGTSSGASPPWRKFYRDGNPDRSDCPTRADALARGRRRGLRVVAHDRQRIGRRHVPAGRKIWCRPLGRNSEDQLDLADVGGQAGAATHSRNITRPSGEAGITVFRTVNSARGARQSAPVCAGLVLRSSSVGEADRKNDLGTG
jgi:hypothetical protein